jgi:peroxiredoxin
MAQQPYQMPPDPVQEPDDHPQRRREWSGAGFSLLLPILIVAAIVAAIWYLQTANRGGTAGSDGFGVTALPDAKNATGKPPAAERERAAPDFVLQALDGSTVRLSDLQGRPVIINLWATWCAPCRSEMPELVRAYAEHQDKGLVVLAVDVKESESEIQHFAQEFGMTFPILLDRAGQVASAYRMTGLPQSYFVDRKGVIRELSIGAMDRAALQQKLATILAE